MMDRVASLNVFLQAAELRNFTAAGRRLGISASAVGKAISRLEERLGVQLFLRSTRSVTLTTEGEIFLVRCRRIFAEIEAAEADFSSSTATPAGRLRISVPLTGMLLTPAIAEFARAFPLIELDIDFSDRLVDIIEEGFDIVLRTGSATDSRLMTRTIGSFSFAVVASPDYLARAGTPQTPEDLKPHACLHHRRTTSGKLVDWGLKRDGAKLDLVLPTTMILNTVEPLIGLAERGIGITSLPNFAVRRQLREGSLISILGSYMDDAGAFRMVWPEGRQLLPRVRAFIEFMSEHLAGELDEGK